MDFRFYCPIKIFLPENEALHLSQMKNENYPDRRNYKVIFKYTQRKILVHCECSQLTCRCFFFSLWFVWLFSSLIIGVFVHMKIRVTTSFDCLSFNIFWLKSLFCSVGCLHWRSFDLIRQAHEKRREKKKHNHQPFATVYFCIFLVAHQKRYNQIASNRRRHIIFFRFFFLPWCNSFKNCFMYFACDGTKSVHLLLIGVYVKGSR